TDTLMLSGNGPDDAVSWDFTVSGGMKAGQASKIAVPSNWQTQGFGHYQYGYDKGPRASDKGVYTRSFTVPADWKDKNVRIVFDGVMTDTQVKVNGTVVGAVHQGGFNRFSYDITRFVKVGEANTLEVEVSEASANTATDIAERHGDYWAFGGIYRPVWLEATPLEAIAHVALDGQADGDIIADIALRAPKTVTKVVGQVVSLDGKAVGAPFSVALPAGGAGKVRLSGHVDKPALWTAETPNLYYLDVTLYAGDTAVHTVRERFGFRTFEIREGDGLYVNGQRVMMKGVVRHTFRPETGRAITREQAYEDARLIKSMNMNAMRVAHYAPDKAFLEAADELGLYVIDELSGWQKAHDTENGRKLVRSLVERDVNHPSILIWSNGNEGGWNTELDADFTLYDPQARPVIHPWAPFGGIDTKHYPRYPDLMTRLNGKMLVMPTEFLHGLFDGGHGSGLDDYWKAMTASKNGAGGFLWVLADEGVVRTDQNGRIDNYAAYAPDGIVGPHHEKEPSVETIRDIWSPVQIDAPVLDAGFTGALKVRNGYDFTSLSDVTFKWEWVRFAGPDAKTTAAKVLSSGTLTGPVVAPHGAGELIVPLGKGWQQADALRLTAVKGDATLLTWVWPTVAKAADVAGSRIGTPKVERTDTTIRLVAGKVTASFDPATGLLTSVSHNGKIQTLSNGPRLVLARPKDKAEPVWTVPTDAGNGVYSFDAPAMANSATIDLGTVETDGWASFKLEVSPDGRTWKQVYDGGRVLPRDGLTYSFAPQPVKAIRISNLAGVRQTPKVVSVKLGFEAARYALPEKGAVTVTTGAGKDAQTGKAVAWLDAPNAGGLDSVRWTLREDGTLSLDYGYSLNGPMLYHGVGFDKPLGDVTTVRGLLRGPTPVWQNRLRGPVLGVWDIASKTTKGALRPDTAGYFADPRWVKLSGGQGNLTIISDGAPFVQIGKKPEDFPTTTVEFPNADIGFMSAIPAMGAKFQAADLTGPQGQPSVANGTYAGRLVFGF
ncbi:glycoside hydrolase family 2 TIM barrel-domain containing protein, partial [Asticcacaulis sp. BYS171W]